MQFISWEISQATSSLTFSTRNSRLNLRDSRLDTRNYRGSRIKARGTVNLLLSGTVVYANLQHGVQMFSQISHIPDLIRKFGAKKCGLYASVYGSHVFILFCRRLIGIFFYCWSLTFVNLQCFVGHQRTVSAFSTSFFYSEAALNRNTYDCLRGRRHTYFRNEK